LQIFRFMLNYLRLIRIQNLLIIIAAQYLLRYALILPILANLGFESQVSHLGFLFMSLATALIAAGGYVINDYFDTKTDSLNRPDTVIIGKHISRRGAILLHIVLNIIGIALGLLVSLEIEHWKLGNIYVLITALLWFYSASFKRRYLIGNLIVAVLTGLSVLLPVLYELPPLYANYAEELALLRMDFNILIAWGIAYSGFAFLTTLSREIIKDAEDFEGDQAYGRRTIPVVSGIRTVKYLVVSINVVVVLLLAFGYVYTLFCAERFGEACLSHDYLSGIYIGLLIIFPNIYLIFKVLKSKSKKDWHQSSVLAKLIMLAGILYTAVAYYLLTT